MKRLRIYVDTSVIGGCLDPEFAVYSNQLMDAFRAGTHVAVVSPLTLGELLQAPAAVQQILRDLPVESVEYVAETEEVTTLAKAYVEAGVVSPGSTPDAVHIASATVYDADVLVSWNFKHIVNLARIRRYNAINLMNGYGVVEIRSPREVLDAR